MSTRTQIDLIDRAVERDALAFARLIEPLTVRLLVFLRRRGADVLGPDCDEEDLFQIVLATAWRLLPDFEDRGPGSFHRWMLTLSRHALNDRVKYVRAKSRDGHPLSGSDESDIGGKFGPVDTATSISVRVSHREQCAAIELALETLDPDARTIVEMHLLDACSLSQIATSLGVSKNAIWERLRRSMQSLRKEMEGQT